MTIAVIGAGAIGSLVAANLTKAGSDVCLIGRPRQFSSIAQKGLRIKSSQGEETVKVKALGQLDGEYDLVIFTVKTQDLEAAFQHNHRFLENCLVLTTQNGVQADNMLCTHFELGKMYSSIVMFGATYVNDGEVTYNFSGEWILGKPFQPNDARIHDLAAVLGKAFPIVISTNIMGMKWLKLFVNFNNCVPALIGKTMQETFADLDLCRLSVLLLKEGVQLVKNAGIEMTSLPNFPVERILGLAAMPDELAATIVQKTMTGLSQEPLYGSVLQSLMRGRASEIDFINGEVAQLARAMQTRAPLNDRVVSLIHQIEQDRKFLSPEAVKKEFGLSRP